MAVHPHIERCFNAVQNPMKKPTFTAGEHGGKHAESWSIGQTSKRCGRSPGTHPDVEVHADHILAVAKGGQTVMENLQTLCQDCNLGKGRTMLS